MGAIVSFTNQKGGVGKTTSAINLAAALGKKGKKVLLIDLDPQGNSTGGLGVAKKSLRATSYDVLIGRVPARRAILETEFAGLSLLPTNRALAGAENEIAELENREFCLKKALESVREDYDYLLIDCPPAIGLLTVNALAASDGLIIPMPCEYFALEGLSQLLLSIKKVRELYNPTLQITGILLTMYNPRLVISAQVVAELKKYYEEKLFHGTISRSVKLCEAPGFGKPICYYDRWCRGALEYAAVAKELMLRI